MKLIKCRQPATTVDYSDGYPSYVKHGFTYVIKLCEGCAQS
jgi:hypothetical protein